LGRPLELRDPLLGQVFPDDFYYMLRGIIFLHYYPWAIFLDHSIVEWDKMLFESLKVAFCGYPSPLFNNY